tara:strand:- start:57 stop:260 length:204 start_codon:yes stop_codon:yes gene_type:complete
LLRVQGIEQGPKLIAIKFAIPVPVVLSAPQIQLGHLLCFALQLLLVEVDLPRSSDGGPPDHHMAAGL